MRLETVERQRGSKDTDHGPSTPWGKIVSTRANVSMISEGRPRWWGIVNWISRGRVPSAVRLNGGWPAPSMVMTTSSSSSAVAIELLWHQERCLVSSTRRTKFCYLERSTTLERAISVEISEIYVLYYVHLCEKKVRNFSFFFFVCSPGFPFFLIKFSCCGMVNKKTMMISPQNIPFLASPSLFSASSKKGSFGEPSQWAHSFNKLL